MINKESNTSKGYKCIHIFGSSKKPILVEFCNKKTNMNILVAYCYGLVELQSPQRKTLKQVRVISYHYFKYESLLCT